MNDVNETDGSEGTDVAVVATLYLPKAKGSRAVAVYGKSGTKYGFRVSDARGGLLVREYTSLAQFECEELDIRSHIGQPHIVCSLVGEADPAERARESVKGLIEARLRVASARRLCALREIHEIAEEAILELGGEILNRRAAETQREDEEEMGEVVPEGALVAIPPEVLLDVPDIAAPRMPEVSDPEAVQLPSALEQGRAPYSEGELMQMKFEELKALAKQLDVKGQSRKELVAGVLEKQAQNQP